MATAHGTASPRAPRGRHQPPPGAPAQPLHTSTAKQAPRRARGARHNTPSQAGASPSTPLPRANPALAASAVFPSEEAPAHDARHTKKHTPSQPSLDRVVSPPAALASLTDGEGAPAAAVSSTPAKSQAAYAGPTFHASPAPSALPIPKFLSRSVPAKSRADPPTPPPEDSSDSAGSPASFSASPSRAPAALPSRNAMSPLDLLFQADRAERAKHVGGSPASPQSLHAANPVRPHHHKQHSYGSLNAPFPMELDGESSRPHMSPPSTASPMAVRSVTDPSNIPQLHHVHQPPNDKDVMQDLLARLSMSQAKPTNATPPRAHAQPLSQPHNKTPEPFHDAPPAARSASGPCTPAAVAQKQPDFFYGNRNLSPLFKAAKGDPSKRNSGLRTEITADAPMVDQGVFQDFPSLSSPRAMDPNTYSRNYSPGGAEIPSGPRRGSAPYVQPYRGSPNHGNRRTPGRQARQSRPELYSPKLNHGGAATRADRAGSNGAPASVKKPATSMMSFVPASVSAKPKQLSSSAPPPTSPGPPSMKTSTPPTTSALEQHLKRMLNLNMGGDASGVH
ncbi:hypothetical protein ACEQ8H_002995 [Pleosporales sp. CAS-2024a]